VLHFAEGERVKTGGGVGTFSAEESRSGLRIESRRRVVKGVYQGRNGNQKLCTVTLRVSPLNTCLNILILRDHG